MKQKRSREAKPIVAPAQCAESAFSLQPPALKTEHLEQQVDELLALQPNIADYVRGPGMSTDMSAEAVVACHFIEAATWMHGPRPLVTATTIHASQARVQNELGTIQQRDQTSMLPLVSALCDVFDMCRQAGLRVHSQDNRTAAIRLAAVFSCLLPQEQTDQKSATASARDTTYYSPWDLEVQGRPDITTLKRRLLEHGGMCFEPNYVLVRALQPDQAAKLLENGKFWPGAGSRLMPMQEVQCHTNVMFLAGHAGVEVWTGFARSGCQWVLHSWCIHENRVLETTTAREEYFGIRFPTPFGKLISALKHRAMQTNSHNQHHTRTTKANSNHEK